MTNPPLDAHLDRAFYARPTIEVARALLGQIVVSSRPDGLTAGRIVETEAYLGPDDPASHAARLKRGNVEAMWGEPGIAYVYRSYGIHAMLNVVAEPAGQTGAVLIRALEPLAGLDLMRQRRGLTADRRLCSGPGNLCQALAITLDLHATDLVTSHTLWITPGDTVTAISSSGRIGISRGTEHPWRFWATGNGHVSAHRRETLIPQPPSPDPAREGAS
jgi:DNA-3-methyladenine glycosylase